MKRVQIGIIGPDESEYPKNKKMRARVIKIARELGQLIAENGWILFTGGTGGVMREASRGAKSKGGLVVGTPGNQRGGANEFVDVEVITDIDIGSFNCAGLLSSDVTIAIPGGAGTLAELCLAYRYKKQVIIMAGFDKYYDSLVDGYLDNGRKVKFYGADNYKQTIKITKKLIEKK